MELLEQSASTMARAVRDHEISSVALVTRHLEHIERVNPRINAVVTFASDALQRAAVADSDLAAGKVHGPLHGVPMTIKDCFDTSGVVSTWGTFGRRNFVPDSDATVVARLKAAGAILLGKTNTPEFTMCFETYNDLFGFTHNPFRLDYSPGGSSGGAAALLAVGGIPFDIGTDFGGSIRVPSHFCGTVGLKPTSGSVPRTGLCLPPGMFGDDLSHVGPMARYVEDLALLLSIIWGPDGRDSRIARMPLADWHEIDLGSLRCAIMLDNGVALPDEETVAVVQNTAKQLADAGLQVRSDPIPTTAESQLVESELFRVGISAAVKRRFEEVGTRPHEASLSWFRKILSSDREPVTHDDVIKVLEQFERVRSRSLQFMENYDVLICPVNARPAQPHAQPGHHPFPSEHASYTSLFDVTGFPAGVVRGGTTSDGLPIGVQVVGAPWREDIVLAVMAHLETALGPFARPTAFEG